MQYKTDKLLEDQYSKMWHPLPSSLFGAEDLGKSEGAAASFQFDVLIPNL